MKYWKIDSAVIDDYRSHFLSVMVSRLMTEGHEYVPLNLYSLGSSFLLAMLNDEEALEPAKLEHVSLGTPTAHRG